MSSSQDPNTQAEKLAQLSRKLADDARQAAHRIRESLQGGSGPLLSASYDESNSYEQHEQPEQQEQQEYEGGQHEDEQRGQHEYEDNSNFERQDSSRNDNNGDVGYAPQVASWVNSTYGANKPKPHIVIKGAKFSAKSPKHEDTRTANVIIAKSVDIDRDHQVGVPISRYNLNYVFAEPDERDHFFGDLFGTPDPNYLPATSDLRPSWGDIFDQLDLGSCVSNSVAYALRYCYKKQKLGDFTPSRLFIYYNGRQVGGYPLDEDTGLTIRDGYKSVSRFSTCGDNMWPYDPEKFTQSPPQECYTAAREHSTFRYIHLDNDVDQIKKCLKDGYPVSFGTALFSSFMSADTAITGIVTIPNPDLEERIGGHAMTIIGHDDSKGAFLVVNNWGEKWGEKGCCWFPYEYMINDEYVSDLWSPRWFS